LKAKSEGNVADNVAIYVKPCKEEQKNKKGGKGGTDDRPSRVVTHVGFGGGRAKRGELRKIRGGPRGGEGGLIHSEE